MNLATLSPRPPQGTMYPMNRVHCASCGKTLGYTKAAKLNGAIVCGDICGDQPSVTSTEERDDVIAALYRSKKFTVVGLAVRFDLKRQRIYQILAARGIPVGDSE